MNTQATHSSTGYDFSTWTYSLRVQSDCTSPPSPLQAPFPAPPHPAAKRPRTDLASLGVGGEQVDHLDAGDQDLLRDAHVDEVRRLGVDGGPLVRLHRAPLVDRLT